MVLSLSEKLFVSKIFRGNVRELLLSFFANFEESSHRNHFLNVINCNMSDRKFFSGLTDGMMKRNVTRGVDRQQSHFYWPDETDMEQVPPPRHRMRNRSLSNASLVSQSQVSSDNEVSRQRRSKQNESKIGFYDMVDVGTDNESVYSRTPDPTKQKKLETLKSGIEFFDYVDTHNPKAEKLQKRSNNSPSVRNLEPSVIEHKIAVTTDNEPRNEEEPSRKQNGKELQSERNLTQIVQDLSLNGEPINGFAQNSIKAEASRKKVPQYIDSFSESDEDDRYSRGRNQVVDDRRYLPPQSRYPPSQCSSRSRPRRQNSDYYDFDDDEYDRQYDARLKYRKPQMAPPRMARRREYYPDMSDEDLYDDVDNYRRSGDYLKPRAYPPTDRYSSRSSRLNDSEPYRRNRKNGYTSDIDFQRDSLPPVRKPSPQNQSNVEAEEKYYQSEMEQRSPEPRMPASARPPVKPAVTRAMSINESKQRYHVNLKSNIFHNDPEYNQIVEQRKPLSVRDFAARQRVGVGLPDI